MSKRTLWALALVASVWGVAADFPSYVEGDWGALAATIGAPSFAIAGAVAASRRPENRTGVILLLTAFVWPLGSVYKYEGVIYQQITFLFAWLWVIPLVYLILAFPSGKLERRKDALLCWIVSVPAFWLALPELPLFRFTSDGFRLIAGNRPILVAIERVVLIISVAILGVLIARVRTKWRRASQPGRRALAPVVVTGSMTLFAVILLLLGLNYVSFMKNDSTPYSRIVWAIAASVPLGFLVGLARARARRARMGELVIELGELPTPERFQDALRKALGDPNLIAAFWVPAAQRYLTAEGRSLSLPEEGSEAVATFLERDGEPLAVIVHDQHLMEDPALVAGATAAARLAVENERLQQEVLEQLTEVRASRSRIIQAGDDARRRLERDLHDGAQQRLVSLGLHLQRIASKLDPPDMETAKAIEDARADLKEALTELRDLARGLHPLVLSEEGLGAAVESLARRSPLPVRIGELPEGRLPQPVETAAYFVVSEALANVIKHARATAVEVSISDETDALTLSISDDGIGGASIAAGSGLRGLADRLEAIDGSISISSPPGAGTLITATLLKTLPLFKDQPTWVPLPDRGLAEVRTERTTGTDLLRVRDLEVFYGEQEVLFNINLSVEPGEAVAVLGTNGSGKSTLARTIAGLHEQLRGSINFDGRELTDVPAEQRSRAGLLFIEGGAGVFDALTVDENLRLFARHAGVPLEEALARVSGSFPALLSKASQRAASLSRGEQHMLALARAAMCNASLVVIDELSLGLSPAAADEVYDNVARLRDEGTAILFIEQSVALAQRLAERAYYLDAGRVLFEGSIAELESSGLITPRWMRREGLAHV